jgi:hypothetical protein
MNKKLQISLLGLAVLFCMPMSAQIKIKGVLHNNRYDDGGSMESTWIGSIYDDNGNYTGKTAFIVDQGIYTMTVDKNSVSTPEKEPAVNLEDIQQGSKIDYEKAIWATNFNLMVGNSGAVYIGGKLVTVFSRDYQSTEDGELFAVRKWDATTGELLSRPDVYMDVSANIESAGMSYNPVDGKVYGFFHITDAKLLDEIVNDPEYFADQDDTDWGREGLDDGYCLGTIDLKTMKITPITPGLYYGNFVAFAINSEGRAFTLTSGGTAGYEGADGKIYNADNVLTGAQLIEIDTKTGLMIRNQKEVTDPETGESYIEYTYPYPATGYCSQVSRQAACFAKSDPNKLYWVGFYNSGKGYSNGSWTSLPDRDKTTGETWRDNGKYDTALYEIDLITGVCTRVAKIPNRCSFSCLWIEGDDNSDGIETDILDDVDVEEYVTLTYNIDDQSSLQTTVKAGDLKLSISPKDGWKVEQLTVNGTDKLSDYSKGKLALTVDKNTSITVVFGWANAENLYSEDITGIVNIEGEGIKVQAKDGQICVDGAAGKTVRLFTTGGNLIATAVPTEGKTGKFAVPQGTYIVQIGNKAAKITVR